MTTTTLRKMIEGGTDEPIQSIVLAFGEWDTWLSEEWPEWAGYGHLVAYEEVPEAVLSKRFNDGYGGECAPKFYAWTENFVLVKGTYDGAEWCQEIPRHPTSAVPESVGGG